MQASKFRPTYKPTRRMMPLFLSALLAFPTFASAQDQPAPPPPPPADSQSAIPSPANNGGWKRVGDQAAQMPQAAADPNGVPMQAPPPAAPTANGPADSQPSYGPQNQGPQQGYPQQQPYPQRQPYSQQQPYPQQSYQAPPPVPASLTVPAGTYVTVRVNQLLSSDRNQQGDAFSATLVKPLVVNGVVVAEPGQTLGGHVTEAVKAGRIEGVARLGVQLTDLTLVDGQQIPIHSSLINRSGPSSVGQDVGTIAGTTALGAAVGAAAAWGKGAAIGAGSGAALGIIGVLLTRGHPSVLYPEQVLTFRIEAPLTIATDRSPQAFHYVEPGEYDRPGGNGPQGPGYGAYTAGPYPPAPLVAAPYYGYPYPYYAYGYPYYYGPSFSLFFGGRYYGGYGHRYYGGRYRR